MMRELKMVFKMVDKDFCDILCETRDNSEGWEKQGIIPTCGTIKECMQNQIETHTRFGWALDSVSDDTLIFQKKF